MSESIIVYNRSWEQIKFQERDNFTKEQKEYYFENWEVQYAAWSIWWFLWKRNWELRLVKRWKTRESSFLYDKTVWGHMNPWEHPHRTLRREVKEELWIKVKIARNKDEFEYFLNKIDLTKRAVMMIMDHDPWLWVEVDPKKPWDRSYEKRYNATIYYWIYEWEFIFDKNEAIEWENIVINKLNEAIENDSEKYTKSLVDMINRYKNRFLEIFK